MTTASMSSAQEADSSGRRIANLQDDADPFILPTAASALRMCRWCWDRDSHQLETLKKLLVVSLRDTERRSRCGRTGFERRRPGNETISIVNPSPKKLLRLASA